MRWFGGDHGMRRRQFIRTGVIATGLVTVSGRSGAIRNEPEPFPEFDTPQYGNWIPAESHADPESGIYFTHVDWATITELEDEEGEADNEEIGEVVDQVPIMGLPLYGAILNPLALFGILFYPFAEHVLPQNGQTAEGIETATSTWTDDLLVFHGEYSPEVFAEEYAEGFTEEEQHDDYSVFVADDPAFGPMGYAVSEDTLVVGMHPGDESEYHPKDIVNAALNRNLEETDRMVDEDDGKWLFEATGEAQMAFGGWQMEELGEALDPDVEEGEDAEPGTEPELDENPVYDNVESVVNTIVFIPEGGEMVDLEARYAGIYPENQVPSEDDVLEYLIGEPDVPHEINIEGTRVHATASFEELPAE